jgi:hypothetical protein
MNHLEELLSQWYEYQGYFVRRNIKVGKRQKGGYKGELDIIAFNPENNHLLHLEPSSDTNSWAIREKRYKTKFKLGKTYIPKLFKGINLPEEIDQRAIFLFGGKSQESVGGGKVYLVREILEEITEQIKHKRITSEIIPENFFLLRTLQIYLDSERYFKK